MQDWYQKWVEKEREINNKLTYENLVSSASRCVSFIDGQLSSGNYDSQDIFGQAGHVDALYYTQEVIYQKAKEAGVRNPPDFFAESNELHERGVKGPTQLA